MTDNRKQPNNSRKDCPQSYSHVIILLFIVPPALCIILGVSCWPFSQFVMFAFKFDHKRHVRYELVIVPENAPPYALSSKKVLFPVGPNGLSYFYVRKTFQMSVDNEFKKSLEYFLKTNNYWAMKTYGGAGQELFFAKKILLQKTITEFNPLTRLPNSKLATKKILDEYDL